MSNPVLSKGVGGKRDLSMKFHADQYDRLRDLLINECVSGKLEIYIRVTLECT